MRILFAGTPALAVPCLRASARKHEVAAVLTSPDKPGARGSVPLPSPVAAAAAEMGLPLLQPARLDAAFLTSVAALGADLLVAVAFGRIFRQELLSLFPHGGMNVHPSLLPRWRGPSPIPAAILCGDAETGVTVQRMALAFDTGEILAQQKHPLRGDETSAGLSEELAGEGASLLARVLDDLAEGRPPHPIPQDEARATYCHILRKEDGIIRWSEPAEAIERKVRAYDPWPRARTSMAGETLLLLKSHVYPDSLGQNIERGAPGTVVAFDKGHGLLVSAGSGVVAVERLQLQFRKPTDGRAFLNGHPAIMKTRLGE